MINKLYISTVEHVWTSGITLLGQHNLDNIINDKKSINVGTSVDDLQCSNISKACNSAKEIILISLSPNITNHNCFSYGRLYNQLLKVKHKVIGLEQIQFNLDKFNVTNNSTEQKALWAVGCSVTHGSAIESSKRWSTLVAKQLKLKEISLSQPGSSIAWAADQILRSDIKEGDIVVWGLTNVPRVEVAKDWESIPINIDKYIKESKDIQYWNLDYFESQTQVFLTIRNILQVIDYCKKIKAELYIVNLLDIAWLSVALHKFENFLDLTEGLEIINNNLVFIDNGVDNLHPGTLQHQEYAKQILNFIKENNHGNQTI